MRCLGCMMEIDVIDVCPHCGYQINSLPKEVHHLRPGTVLEGHYLVGKSIGYGGFGVTYVGYDLVLERKIAIKEYFPSEFATRAVNESSLLIFNDIQKQEQFENGLRRFIEESQRLAKFNSFSGIVDVYDGIIENNTGYIIMEYLDGITLKDYLKENGKLSFEETLEIIQPIFDALKEAHKENIIHRDIAPDNIFLTYDNGPKLIDFGAARYATTSHSKSLSVILKPGYAPEEQYRSKGELGPWSDVYALCATMYQMMSGIVPQDSIERAGNDRIIPLSKLGVKINKNAEITLMNGLNIRPQNRIQNIDELENGLTGKSLSKRIKETGLVADIGQWPIWMKISVPVTSIIAVVVSILMFIGVIDFRGFLSDIQASWEAEANVPNLINLSLEEAEKKAQEAGFQLGTDEGKIENDFVKKDTVISQSPTSGVLYDTTQKIQVVISAGPVMIEVPNLVDTDADDAKRILENLGFVVVLKHEDGPEFFENAVMKQSVKENTQYGRNGKITLTVSNGNSSLNKNETTTIPNITGMSIDEARSAFAKQGVFLRLKGSDFSSTDDDIGKILTQAASGTAKKGDIIDITISKGVFKFYIPDLQLKNNQTAQDELIGLGAKPSQIKIEEQYHQSISKGQVISQNRESGTLLSTNDVIILVISKGPDSFTIPNLTGKTISEARNILLDMQVPSNIILVERQSSETIHSGQVISQSIQAGQVLKINSSITLIESTGGAVSEWTNTLPNGVNSQDYIIEESAEYRTRARKIAYGEWSGWTSTSFSPSETLEVNTRYRTRTKGYETCENSASSLSGWNQTGFYWTNWSSWQDDSISGTSDKEVGTQKITIQTGSTHYYVYYHYTRPDTGNTSPIDYGGSLYTHYNEITVTSPLTDTGRNSNANGARIYEGSTCGCGGVNWYYLREYDEPIYGEKTQYRYRTKVYKYERSYWNNWSSWNNGNPPAASADMEVEVQYQTRTVKIEPSGNWSEWSRQASQPSEYLEVETRPIYRYQFR